MVTGDMSVKTGEARDDRVEPPRTHTHSHTHNHTQTHTHAHTLFLNGLLFRKREGVWWWKLLSLLVESLERRTPKPPGWREGGEWQTISEGWRWQENGRCCPGGETAEKNKYIHEKRSGCIRTTSKKAKEREHHYCDSACVLLEGINCN